LRSLRGSIVEIEKRLLIHIANSSRVRQMESDLRTLAKIRAPRDTGGLENSIDARVSLGAGDVTITVFINGREYAELASVLEQGGNGSDARRSEGKPKNAKGSPVEGWWSDFVEDVNKYLSSGFRIT
jgi:hypothetical protein